MDRNERRNVIKTERNARLASFAKDLSDNVIRINKGYDLLDQLVTQLDKEGIDLLQLEKERIVDVNISQWNCDPLVSIRPNFWLDTEKELEHKEIYDSILIALTGIYGAGERDVYGSDGIQYEWEPDTDEGEKLRLSMSAETAGCKLVEETVTETVTRKKYSIKCGDE